MTHHIRRASSLNHYLLLSFTNMPYKQSTEFNKLPRKKANVRAYWSSISRSAVEQVNIDSMVDLSSSPSAPLKLSETHIEDKTLQDGSGNIKGRSLTHIVQTVVLIPPSTDVKIRTFCHFCSGHTTCPHKYECVNCRAIVCK
jgi:hypothetical protein